MVKHGGLVDKLVVTADGSGQVGHAGSALLAGAADRVGLTAALSAAMAPTRERRSAHDPGGVVHDLVVTLADGGDCLADLGALRDQPDPLGTGAELPRACPRPRDRLGQPREALLVDRVDHARDLHPDPRALAGGAVELEASRVDAHHEAALAASPHRHVAADEEGETSEHLLLRDVGGRRRSVHGCGWRDPRRTPLRPSSPIGSTDSD